MRLTRKHKIIIAILCAVFVLASAVVELTIGWQQIMVWSGLQPSPVTVEGEMEVHFINVGNADSILIRQGDQAMLIDAGERGDGDDILDYLLVNGVSHLNLVIATHPHADHIGGMAQVIEEMPVDRFVMAFMPEDATPTTASYENMLVALDEKSVEFDEAQPGTVYELGEARIQVLAPLELTDETNDMSVVTRLTFGDHAFMLTGDAGTAVEKQLMQSDFVLDADVLKVSHHGSTTGNSASFLSVVAPKYAVITCGLNNKYGHPTDEVIKRLASKDIQVYRSDISGHIVFRSDGKELTVETKKE